MAAAAKVAKVKGYPAYTVTTGGKVFSTWRSKEPVELTPQPDRDGRPFVGMFNEQSNGKAFHASVARLVLEAFVRPGKPGECAGYRDFDPKNVSKGNVFWTTRSEAAKRKAKRAKLAAGKGAKVAKPKLYPVGGGLGGKPRSRDTAKPRTRLSRKPARAAA